MESLLGKAVVTRFGKGYGSRANWNTLWQSVARYCLPNDAQFLETTVAGQDRMRYILDSTAPRSLEMFASFLHTLLNNPASRWIRLTVEAQDPTKISITEKQWFEQVENIMLSALAAEQADIYAQLHQIYLALGAFGTGVLYVDMPNGILRVRQYHLEDCVPEEGASEQVDTMFRKQEYTRRQALKKWPAEKLMKLKAFEGKPQTGDDSEWMEVKKTFIHFCVPTSDSMAAHLSDRFLVVAKEGGFSHVGGWVVQEDKEIVEEMGWHEFPYVVPRWYKARGEVYGRSPSMTNLPDIRMVNRMSDTILRGAEKIVDPPLAVKDGGLVSPVRLGPGGITYVEGDTEIKTLIPPGTSRIETGNQLLEQRQQAIREGYFVPLFVTPDSPVKTATQVLQEVDERNRAVSPMLVRIQAELFHPLIKRVYGLLDRAGRIPEAPQSLIDDVESGARRLRLEYTSPLIASQRQLDGLSIVRLFQTMAPWAQVDPGIFDNIDIDETGRVLHAASGSPSSIWRTEAKRNEVREARMQRIQQQQTMQALAEGGKVAADIASAIKPSG